MSLADIARTVEQHLATVEDAIVHALEHLVQNSEDGTDPLHQQLNEAKGALNTAQDLVSRAANEAGTPQPTAQPTTEAAPQQAGQAVPPQPGQAAGQPANPQGPTTQGPTA